MMADYPGLDNLLNKAGTGCIKDIREVLLEPYTSGKYEPKINHADDKQVAWLFEIKRFLKSKGLEDQWMPNTLGFRALKLFGLGCNDCESLPQIIFDILGEHHVSGYLISYLVAGVRLCKLVSGYQNDRGSTRLAGRNAAQILVPSMKLGIDGLLIAYHRDKVEGRLPDLQGLSPVEYAYRRISRSSDHLWNSIFQTGEDDRGGAYEKVNASRDFRIISLFRYLMNGLITKEDLIFLNKAHKHYRKQIFHQGI